MKYSALLMVVNIKFCHRLDHLIMIIVQGGMSTWFRQFQHTVIPVRTQI